jgi:hypothetical protein
VTLLTDSGIEQFILEDADSIAFVDPELQKNVAAALSRLASHRSDGRRRLTLESRGTGSRSIRVGYVVEVPLWKASYRLNLPGDPKADPARLQGWAILENFSGQAWHDVSLTLLSGNPVTFRNRCSRVITSRGRMFRSKSQAASYRNPTRAALRVNSEPGTRQPLLLLGCRRRPEWPALPQKPRRHQLRLRAPRRRSKLLRRQKRDPDRFHPALQGVGASGCRALCCRFSIASCPRSVSTSINPRPISVIR